MIYKMKKGLLLGLLLMITAGISFSQETISLNVVYEFRYVRDLTQKDNPYISNMVLSLGKGTSRYCTEREYKESDKNSIARKKQQIQTPASGRATRAVSGGPALFVGKSGVTIREEIMKDIPKRKMETTGFIGTKTYSVETALPKINWVLQQERKMIDKYTCQKATGQYAGREYTVWFTPDLPFQDGPWKLSGLPGLILEAHDTNNEVVFTFKGISRNDDAGETVVSVLKDQFTINTSLKSYNRTRASFDADPEAIILAEHPDARIFVFPTDSSGTRKVMKIKQYNPIEKD
jgi:GLPGLI family protein